MPRAVLKRTLGGTTENRELFLSLKEKSNAALRDSIVTGRTGATELVNFDKEASRVTAPARDATLSCSCSLGWSILPQALASETLKAERVQLERENMFAAQSAGATDAETDAFKCGKCGQRKTRYYQMQTRSADEPMTVSGAVGGACSGGMRADDVCCGVAGRLL